MTVQIHYSYSGTGDVPSSTFSYPDREQYYRDLQERQRRHLESLRDRRPWKPCMHEGCTECHGTGLKRDGSTCIHMLHCDCPHCTPYSM